MVTSRKTRSSGSKTKTLIRPILAAPAFAEQARVVPAPLVDETPGKNLEVAVLAGGCFWGVQGVFSSMSRA